MNIYTVMKRRNALINAIPSWYQPLINNGATIENLPYLRKEVNKYLLADFINISGCYNAIGGTASWMAQKPSDGTADFDWDRDTTVNTYDPLGDLRVFGFDVPNVTNRPAQPIFIPITSLEPQATGRTTNIFTMGNNGSITATDTDYFGITGLDRVTCTNTGTGDFTLNSIKGYGSIINPGLDNQELSFQMYLGYVDSRYLSFYAELVDAYFNVDLQTGVVTSPDNSFINIISEAANDGEGWLINMTSLKVTGSDSNPTLRGGPVTALGDSNNVAGSFLQGLFQVEINTFPTSLINGSGVIRLQDKVSRVTDASFFNNDGGVWLFEIENYADGTFGLHDLSGGLDDRFTISISNNDVTILSKSSLGTEESVVVTIDPSAKNEFIIVWSRLREVYKVYLNGVFNIEKLISRAPQNLDSIIWSNTSLGENAVVKVYKQVIWNTITNAESDLGYSLIEALPSWYQPLINNGATIENFVYLDSEVKKYPQSSFINISGCYKGGGSGTASWMAQKPSDGSGDALWNRDSVVNNYSPTPNLRIVQNYVPNISNIPDPVVRNPVALIEAQSTNFMQSNSAILASQQILEDSGLNYFATGFHRPRYSMTAGAGAVDGSNNRIFGNLISISVSNSYLSVQLYVGSPTGNEWFYFGDQAGILEFNFNLLDGSIANSSTNIDTSSYNSTPFDDGWLVSFSTIQGTYSFGNSQIRGGLVLSSTSTEPKAGEYWCGLAQIEESITPTSLIVAQGTRLRDIVEPIVNTSLFGNVSGAWIIKLSKYSVGNIIASDGSSNNVVQLAFNNGGGIVGVIGQGGSRYVTQTFDFNEPTEVLICWESSINRTKVWINGVYNNSSVIATATPQNISTIEYDGVSTNIHKNIVYSNLADAEADLGFSYINETAYSI
jgi:hypothetical protein